MKAYFAEYQSRFCGGCDLRDLLLVQVGEEQENESQTAVLCIDCVRDALKVLEDAEAAKGK
jgi:hypothetical protein